MLSWLPSFGTCDRTFRHRCQMSLASFWQHINNSFQLIQFTFYAFIALLVLAFENWRQSTKVRVQGRGSTYLITWNKTISNRAKKLNSHKFLCYCIAQWHPAHVCCLVHHIQPSANLLLAIINCFPPAVFLHGAIFFSGHTQGMLCILIRKRVPIIIFIKA